nr:vacuolar cation/proton exchanger 3-like [Ipomoea batatas]
MGSFEGKLDLENGGWGSTKAEVEEHPAGAGASCRTAHSLSSSMVRKKSDPELVSRVRFRVLRDFLANLQEVILGTKLCVLFPAIPLAVLAQFYSFGRRKIHVVKYSLLGSILSNLLLVLGSSLFCGGLANIKKEQRFDRKQADVNAFLLLLGLLCLMLPLMFRYSFEAGDYAATSVLWLSRVSSIFMFVAYIAYLFFQLKTHRQFFEAPEEEGDKLSEDEAVIGFWSAFVWLIAMTITIALLSEYVVGTIEAASDSWGLSVSFISLILLPIVGNAAEHAGSIIFAFKNKLDISLGVALGSASQIFDVRGSIVCSCGVDNGHEDGSGFQPSGNGFSCNLNHPNCIHLAGWNLTLHERSDSVPFLLRHCRLLLPP